HALWQVSKCQAFGVLVHYVVKVHEEEVRVGNVVGFDSASEDPITLIVVIDDERTLRTRKDGTRHEHAQLRVISERPIHGRIMPRRGRGSGLLTLLSGTG